MKKDVIYIDTEDDLTTVIEKIKNSSASIVALVPPRRLGMLQSVVNLKLLKRAADEADKKAVLITSDQSLIGLTAGIGLPVARNLQSRPEVIPEANDEINDVPDVIEGQMDTDSGDGAPRAVQTDDATPSQTPPSKSAKPKAKKPGKRFKVPNFESFRKRFVLIGVAVVLLIAFLVWAIFYAPKATVVIKAQSEKVAGDVTATVDSDLAGTNVNERALKAELHQSTDNLTQKFTPTGKKDVGDKAKGTITIRNCDYADGFTLQSGARFTASSGQSYVSTKSVTVPQFSGSASSCKTSGSSAGKATVPVEAADIGEEYNIGSGKYSIPGISGKVDAVGTAMSGGSKRTVSVVTKEDVAKAKSQALEQSDDSVQEKLTKQFEKDVRALKDTFKAEQGDVQVEPGIGEEASGEATLTVPMTYTILGIKNDDLSALLSEVFENEIDNEREQKVYDNGYKKVQITIKEQPSAQKAEVTFKTDGYIGPNIDTENLKQQIAGKRHGEIEAIIKPTPGVQSVDTHFSPFWVTKAPKAEKITINLEVANEE